MKSYESKLVSYRAEQAERKRKKRKSADLKAVEKHTPIK